MRYKAFISYRHLEPDKSVAKRLQKLLEGMKQPKGTEQWRIFRDESELPTSSNLSDDIEAALKESEYLIVICSPKLGQSIWCRQEIETFKNLHGGSTTNIFTVLVEGAPDESFPDELCVSRKKIEENGQVSYKDEKVEPLAANVVAKTVSERNKLLQTEYLRIAAPMMGVSYDSLFDRKKRAKLKKTMSIVGSAAAVVTIASVGFGVYSSAMNAQITQQNNQIIEQNDQISEQLEIIKTENAKNYNLQSRNNYKDHRTRDALENVLKAYEINDDYEPILADSDILLSDEMGIYEKDVYFPQWRLEHEETITGLWLLMDGKRLVTTDTGEHAYIWDTQTGECLWKSEDRVSRYDLIINTPRKMLSSGGIAHNRDKYVVEYKADRWLLSGYVRGNPEEDNVEADDFFYYKYFDSEQLQGFAKKVDVNEAKIVEESIALEKVTGELEGYIDDGAVINNCQVYDLGDCVLVENRDASISDITTVSITLKNKNNKEVIWSNKIDVYGTVILDAGIQKKDDLVNNGTDVSSDVIFYVYANKIDFFNAQTGEKIANKSFEDAIIDYYYNAKGAFWVTLLDGRTELVSLLSIMQNTSPILIEEDMPKMLYHGYSRGVEAVGYQKSKYVDLYKLTKNDEYKLLIDEENTQGNGYANSIRKIYLINDGMETVVVTNSKIYKLNNNTGEKTVIDEVKSYGEKDSLNNLSWEEAKYEQTYLIGDRLWVVKRNLDNEWDTIRIFDVKSGSVMGSTSKTPGYIPSNANFAIREFTDYEAGEAGFYFYNEKNDEKLVVVDSAESINNVYSSEDGNIIAYMRPGKDKSGNTYRSLYIYDRNQKIDRCIAEGFDRSSAEIYVDFRDDGKRMGYIDKNNPEGFYLVDVEHSKQKFIEIPGKIIEGIYLADEKIYLFGSLADTYVYDYDMNQIGTTNLGIYKDRFHAATTDIEKIDDETFMIREDSSSSIYSVNDGGGTIYVIDMLTDEVKRIFPCNTYDPVNNRVYGIESGKLFSFPVITGSALYDKAKNMMNIK